jgi:hypothetical protein
MTEYIEISPYLEVGISKDMEIFQYTPIITYC